MNHIDKVREALAFARSAILSGEGYSAECQRVFESAKSALSAHEAEVKELVTKTRALEERAVIVNRNGVNDAELDRLIFEIRAILTKVQP